MEAALVLCHLNYDCSPVVLKRYYFSVGDLEAGRGKVVEFSARRMTTLH